MTRYGKALSTLMATASAAEGTAYARCGGSGWTGAVTCVSGYHCQYQNDWYSQCVPGDATGSIEATTSTKTIVKATTLVTIHRSSGTPHASTAWEKPTTSTHALPAVTSQATTLVTTHRSSGTPHASTAWEKPTTSTHALPAVTVEAVKSSGLTQYAGVNIAGFDFGCSTDGSCSGSYTNPGDNGIAQMKHFATADKLNAFRLPIGWQYLVNNQLGGSLDTTVVAAYDALVQGCLATGALCIIDLHNYARWNGAVVGQGGPTNAQFADVWSKLATKYASTTNIAFGLMNEPHDLTMTTWAASVQAAVTAIRKAGATSQYILLPGTDYTSAGTFVQNSGPALLTVKDTDGTTSKLIFDVHRYLDSDNSGTHAECVTDHVSDTFTPLATWLRTNGRKAILSEIGGGNTASCETDVCAAIASLNKNSDVYLGYIGWSAGAFDTSYTLSMTPTGSTDQPLMSKCFSRA
ncbi:glycoside hydrolase family 5 protein [Didymella exigua CBS 183.55]|uniref:Endoglucanase EG-II n=1 Tax=Didymella exigua CBS 183.55 TaxID=1150837 RepID=A0A6A5RSQ0_9PLEO|nr:glycoside hydrolase family 5 protein [Didymella exigua CBS 183.55]KAF1928537.1 glycoside hydrolase family 5 protein [Didymella exigua CBS 183.55]